MTEPVQLSWPVKRLALARLLSVSGGGTAYVALVFQAYELTESPYWVTAILLTTVGAQSVFLPFAGRIIDTVGRKQTMLGSDVIAALVFVVLAQDWPILPLVLLAGLASIAEAPFLPASAAAVPSIVAPERLSPANGLLTAAASLGRTLGPILAVPLLALGGPTAAYLCNAVSFLLSAALVLSVTIPRSTPSRSPDRVGFVRSGLEHIWATRAVRLIAVSSAAAYITTSFAMVAEPVLAADFGAGRVGYSLMGAGWGIGMMLGSFLVGRRLTAANERQALVVGRLTMGLGMTSVPLTHWFATVPPLMAVGGFGSGVLLVAMHSQLQRNTPDRIRGTVFAIFESIGTFCFIVGVLLAGLLVAWVGVRPAYVLSGLGTLLTAIPLLLNLRTQRVTNSRPEP